MAAHLGELLATALHDDEHDVGAAGGEQRVGTVAVGIVEAVGELAALGVGHVVVDDDAAVGLVQRGEEGEDGVDGGMVEKLVLRVVGLADVGDGLA